MCVPCSRWGATGMRSAWRNTRSRWPWQLGASRCTPPRGNLAVFTFCNKPFCLASWGQRTRMVEKTAAAAAVAAPAAADVPSLLPSLLLLGALQLAVYGSTLFPSIPGGDSGELVSTSYVGGVPHPPGYPTYAMLNWVVLHLVPMGSVAWRANVLNAVCSAAAGVLVFAATAVLTASQHAAWAAAALFVFNRLTWIYAVSAEVFGLNNLFVGAVLLLLCLFLRQPSVALARAGALVLGLGLTNQHTLVLYGVVVVPVVLWVRRDVLLRPKELLLLGLCFAAGLLPYLYLPVVAWRQRMPLTWGDQRSLAGFLTHLLRREYGTFDLAKGESGSILTVTQATMYQVQSLATETFYLLPMLPVVSLLLPLPAELPHAVLARRVLVAMVLFYSAFFNWRANLDLSNTLLAGVHERFWMQPNMVLAMLGGLCCAQIVSLVKARWPAIKQVVLAGAMVLLAVQVGTQYQVRDESNNYSVRDLGRSLLAGLPQDSVLLLMGDLPGNAARYVQACDGVRPDVKLVDLEMSTYDWYVPMLRHKLPGVVFPGVYFSLNLLSFSFTNQFYSFEHHFTARWERKRVELLFIPLKHRHAAGVPLWPGALRHEEVSRLQCPLARVCVPAHESRGHLVAGRL
eukprot:m.253883 g.253883  ORF g.253883 m.253883 type:complete len:627 (-) comp22676_c0_seq3:615-2495(-)